MSYSSFGASTGQTVAQAPQDMQSVVLITYLSSPLFMQDVGQAGSHAPQDMQSSLILYAMILIHNL